MLQSFLFQRFNQFLLFVGQFFRDVYTNFHIQVSPLSDRPTRQSLPFDPQSGIAVGAGRHVDHEFFSVQGLDFEDSQPDKAVADYLIEMGADLSFQPDGIRVGRSDLVGCEIDMNRTPDALPARAVTAAFAEGDTRLINVPQAREKETDRIACMAAELAKLGVQTEELPDGLIVHGQNGQGMKSCALSGHGDHRIVMALSIAGMTCRAATVSFPGCIAF